MHSQVHSACLSCEVLELVTAQQFNKEDDSTGSEDIEDDVSLE